MLGELLTQLWIFCELEVHFEVIPLTRLGTFFLSVQQSAKVVGFPK